MTGLEVVGGVAIWLAGALGFTSVLLSLLNTWGLVDRRAGDITDALELPIGACCLVGAMGLAYERNWVMAAVYIGIAVSALRDWWNRRGRKRAAKLAARVRNLGHRLVVVPVTGGARRSLA